MNRPFEGDTCSVAGRDRHNDDYAIYEKGVGGCVADGIGGAPLGDALSRYVCHVAIRAIQKGLSAPVAVEEARREALSFIRTVQSPCSGASLMVFKHEDDGLEVSWLGDVALFYCENKPSGQLAHSSLEQLDHGISRPIGLRSNDSPRTLRLAYNGLLSLAICTDGAWRGANKTKIANILLSDTSARAKAAEIAFNRNTRDDSTALVLDFWNGKDHDE